MTAGPAWTDSADVVVIAIGLMVALPVSKWMPSSVSTLPRRARAMLLSGQPSSSLYPL